MDMFKYIKINETSRIPKYRQNEDAVINNISNGTLV